MVKLLNPEKTRAAWLYRVFAFFSRSIYYYCCTTVYNMPVARSRTSRPSIDKDSMPTNPLSRAVKSSVKSALSQHGEHYRRLGGNMNSNSLELHDLSFFSPITTADSSRQFEFHDGRRRDVAINYVYRTPDANPRQRRVVGIIRTAVAQWFSWWHLMPATAEGQQ